MTLQLKASTVELMSKGGVKRLRREGFVPVSIQHRGQPTLHLALQAKQLEEVMLHHGSSSFVEIVEEANAKTHSVLIHDVQRDPISRILLQVSFQETNKGETVKTHVPLVFHGEPEAVRLHTAIVQHGLEQLEIRSLPHNMPDHINVDLSHMVFGEVIRVSDLVTNGSYEILSPADVVVASLSTLKAHQIAETADATEAAASV